MMLCWVGIDKNDETAAAEELKKVYVEDNGSRTTINKRGDGGSDKIIKGAV
jgi:hypothetical protein